MYQSQEDRVLAELKGARVFTSYAKLIPLLGSATKKDARSALRIAVSRARRLLAEGEHIENYRNRGYQFVIEQHSTNQPRA